MPYRAFLNIKNTFFSGWKQEDEQDHSWDFCILSCYWLIISAFGDGSMCKTEQVNILYFYCPKLLRGRKPLKWVVLWPYVILEGAFSIAWFRVTWISASVWQNLLVQYVCLQWGKACYKTIVWLMAVSSSHVTLARTANCFTLDLDKFWLQAIVAAGDPVLLQDMFCLPRMPAKYSFLITCCWQRFMKSQECHLILRQRSSFWYAKGMTVFWKTTD